MRDNVVRARDVMSRKKFKSIFNAIYRSSLVLSYTSRKKHRRYVEYRVWGQSRKKGQFPKKVLEQWILRLMDKLPSDVQSYLIEMPFEEDERIEKKEIAPQPDNRTRNVLSRIFGIDRRLIDTDFMLDRVFGFAIFDGYYYYFVGKWSSAFREFQFVEMFQGRDEFEVSGILSQFYKGTKLMERQVKSGKRLFEEGMEADDI